MRNTLIVSAFVGLLTGLVPLSTLADLTSTGALVAFTVVSVGVIVLRRTRPELPRAFRVPGYPVVAALSVVACVYLVLQLSAKTYVLFAVWVALALALYFGYGFKHSRLGREASPDPSVASTRSEPPSTAPP